MNADIHTMTGVYALDALPEDERREFERHLEACDACRQEVAEFRATTARLATPVAETPPPRLREAVLDAVDTTRQERPTVIEMPARSSWTQHLATPAAAVLAVLVVGLSVIVGNLNTRLNRIEDDATAVASVLGAEEVTVRQTSVNGGTARLVAAPSRGEAAFFVSDMSPAPSGKAYQLWLMQDGRPVPAGLFQTGTDGQAAKTLTGDIRTADAVAVTIEPESGSPQPTSEPIMSVSL